MFDLKNYLKNNPLLEELEPNKWTKLDDSNLADYKKEILALIKNAYKEIGGHPNYQKLSDINTNDQDFEVIDLDGDDEPDAVSVSKERPPGTKFVATGHDGSREAKSSVVNHKADKLKHRGFYVEVSGVIQDIFIAKGAPIIKDPDMIRYILKGKDIELNDDGSYQRKIGGKTYTKMLLGKPKPPSGS